MCLFLDCPFSCPVVYITCTVRGRLFLWIKQDLWCGERRHSSQSDEWLTDTTAWQQERGAGADSRWELRLECHAECNLWQQLLKDNKYDYFVQLHKCDNGSREDNPRFTFTIPRTNTWDGSSNWFQSPVFPLCWLLITSEAIKVIPFKMTSCLMHRPRFQIAHCVWTDGRTCNQSW